MPSLSSSSVRTIEKLGSACRKEGFFYITGTGVDSRLISRVVDASTVFFNMPEDHKAKYSMEKGGKAWRGHFPLGSELTSGKPDMKEGIYIGEEEELQASTPPLHGPNILPDDIPDFPNFKRDVLVYMDQMKRIASVIIEAIALSLGLSHDGLDHIFEPKPTQLFRIFKYPPVPPLSQVTRSSPSPSLSSPASSSWGVGKHSDYGMLTILFQDEVGGLEVEAQDGSWVDAPPVNGTFIVNLGDMLERITWGRLRATPHRVRSSTARSRISMPYFYDPGWNVVVKPLETLERTIERERERWDKRDMVREVSRPYGEVLVERVAKVFPDLFHDVIS